MCRGARFGQRPVLTILVLFAPKVALRVALGGCVPLLPCVAGLGGNIVRSGRESRHVGRTGKPALGRSRLDDGVAFWIERDRRDRRPFAGLAAPPARVGPAGMQVEFVLGCEKGAILPGMALRWGHVFDAAVPVFVVVSMDEPRSPVAGGIQVREVFDQEVRPVFGPSEHGLGVGVVIADTGT